MTLDFAILVFCTASAIASGIELDRAFRTGFARLIGGITDLGPYERVKEPFSYWFAVCWAFAFLIVGLTVAIGSASRILWNLAG